MSITYDWERNNWSALPLGIRLSKPVKIGNIATQISGSYEYNFQDDYVAPEWTVNFTIKMLFPLN